jgi:hypothetical protein
MLTDGKATLLVICAGGGAGRKFELIANSGPWLGSWTAVPSMRPLSKLYFKAVLKFFRFLIDLFHLGYSIPKEVHREEIF